MPKKRTPDLKVENHGNGFMVVGTNRIDLAREELSQYDTPEPWSRYAFALVTHYNGDSAVWLSTGPAENFDGALDHVGQPLKRSP